MNNIILSTDSYKTSQYKQYPEKTEKIYSYIESRGGEYDNVVFFGLQYFIYKYLITPISMEDIDYAQEIIDAHMGPGVFNREGWEYILKEHEGRLPVEIKAVPEGTVLGTKQVLLTIENTDEKCAWLTSYLETALLRAVWYPSTVSTISYECRKLIKEYLNATSDNPDTELPFKLHNFGARGVSSHESAGIGGLAHLATGAMGTDTMEALILAKKYYGVTDMPAFSIPAMEHSTVTSWGENKEAESYRNMLDKYKDAPLVACVSDSYDLDNAVENIWGKELREQVRQGATTVVIRPDSGDPTSVVLRTMLYLAASFGYSRNTKGYKVLNNVRVIQGDGIDLSSIKDILVAITESGFSTDNVAFGMGGALLQHCDRDTMKWAMKCSAAKVAGEWRDVYKAPKTDMGKASKRGRFAVVNRMEKLTTVPLNELGSSEMNYLRTVYKDGGLVREQSLDNIRSKVISAL